jgi:hypothetical protein
LFGRETHASTTQSDPLLLPTRNGPYREDGALRWEAPNKATMLRTKVLQLFIV